MKTDYNNHIPDSNIVFFKNYPSESFLLDTNGYIAYNENYEDFWSYERHIIDKIADNEEGYFDFTGSMIDIGACEGTYSMILPFEYFYCFEPNFRSYSFLNVNMILHGKCGKFKSFCKCLSDKREVIEFDGYFTKGNIPEYNFADYNESTVETATLDEYQYTNVKFIKIDVEGMEEKVLRGGVGTIIRNDFPPILFELWPVGHCGMTQEKYDSLVNFLESLGYDILWNWGDFETHLAIHR